MTYYVPVVFLSVQRALSASSCTNPNLGNNGTKGVEPRCWYGADFPPESDWLPFNDLFHNWEPVFQHRGNTPEEVNIIQGFHQLYASEGGFNAAYSFAIMIAESRGDPTIQCGDSGDSCGLFQVRGTVNPCSNQAHPCPEEGIQSQFDCGINGCGARGTNIKTCLQQTGNNHAQAARCYNSGSVIDPNDLRAAQGARANYVNTIANVLLGADETTIMRLGGSECGFVETGTA